MDHPPAIAPTSNTMQTTTHHGCTEELARRAIEDFVKHKSRGIHAICKLRRSPVRGRNVLDIVGRPSWPPSLLEGGEDRRPTILNLQFLRKSRELADAVRGDRHHVLHPR